MKKWKVVLAAAVMMAISSLNVWAAEIGPGVTGRWETEEDGRWYYIKPNLERATSEWQEIKNIWYYFDESGYMKTGWLELDGNRYWLGEDGAMAADTTLTINNVDYTFDASGACQSSYKNPVVIPAEEEKSELHHTVDSMADNILSQITNDSMSQREKAVAIYSWVRGNIRYVSTSEKGDWVKAAYDGIRKKSGDCYTYYAVSLALLNRVGIHSIEVNRLDGHHWWNLVNYGEGWYHFDTCPRSSGGTFCLLTDAELAAYSNRFVTASRPYGSHGFDTSLYPPTP